MTSEYEKQPLNTPSQTAKPYTEQEEIEFYAGLKIRMAARAKNLEIITGELTLIHDANFSSENLAELKTQQPTVADELIKAADSVLILVKNHHITVEQLTKITQKQRQALFSNLNSEESIAIIAELQPAQKRSRFCTLL